MRAARYFCIAAIGAGLSARAQTPAGESAEQRLERLSAAVQQVQTQMDAYQHELVDLQSQIAALKSQLHPAGQTAPTAAASPTDAALEEIRERQAMNESQIATHEQTKVETESKYGLKLTGLILFNAFVNTNRVDDPIDPTYALNGGGSTGLSVRQTILGLEATGPHLLGASSHADLRVDFLGNGSQQTYGASGLLRMRTAHASLRWTRTEAYFAFDRPLIAPNVPTSLVSTAQPNLAWSGDLWTWNPQVGLTHDIALPANRRLRMQAALIDVQDPLLPNAVSTTAASRAQRSRWPGVNGRVALAASDREGAFQAGVGGYFSPHRTVEGYRFDSWAVTGDLRLPIGPHFELTSNVYRGAGLGGLGAGGYVDYVSLANDADQARALNDAGGWVQAKIRRDERLQFNGGYGIDNPFGSDIRLSSSSTYTGLRRNRAAFGNVIYSPSSYLLLSLEYRRLWSSYLNSPLRTSDVIGIAAGYRF